MQVPKGNLPLLTKREYYAAQALIGIAANPCYANEANSDSAARATMLAESLIEALEVPYESVS